MNRVFGLLLALTSCTAADSWQPIVVDQRSGDFAPEQWSIDLMRRGGMSHIIYGYGALITGSVRHAQVDGEEVRLEDLFDGGWLHEKDWVDGADELLWAAASFFGSASDYLVGSRVGG